MPKTPISFKGPAGQLEQLFNESSVFSAYRSMITDDINHWRYNEESKMVYANYHDANSKQSQAFAMSMSWPLSKEIGKCECDLSKPCKHLIYFSIYNKSKLDLLPPFTQQLRALKNISETFVNWLNKQTHDPFPRMARHRMIYILNQDGNKYTLTLYKAYLSQDNQFQVKADLDSSVLQKKQLPKFVSLADQKVLHEIAALGFEETQTFTVDQANHQSLLLAVLKTGRCFWKACYRPPLKLSESHSFESKDTQSHALKIIENIYFSPAENTVFAIKEHQESKVKILPEVIEIQPILTLKTCWVELQWKPGFIERMDVAKIKFKAADMVFSLADVSAGLVKVSPLVLEQIAAWCFQIEKLPSVYAKYDSPISEQFDINDRFMASHFATVVPMLMVLEKYGWDIQIDQSYRLNSQAVNQLYVQVDQQQAAQQSGWFDVEVGVHLADGAVNLLPYLVRAIKTGQFDAVKEDLLIKLDDGRFIDMPKSKILQIINTLNELFDDKQLKNKEKLVMNQHQLLRLAEINKAGNSGQNVEEPTTNVQWLGNTDIQKKIIQLSQTTQLPEVSVPTSLQADLRPYQLTGLAWLHFLYQHELHGILADDMGLGKTLQVLAHILSLKNTQQFDPNKYDAKVLIVAPTSLLGNWHAECKKFTPDLKPLVLTGANRQAHYEQLDQYDVIITSYGVMTRDQVKITAINWHTVVLDEAQAIKNHKTQVAKIAKKLSATHRLCLSGTPMENHLGEIWSLFDFLMPGFLASNKLYQQLYQWPIEKEQNDEAMKALQTRLAPFILRRTKAEVAKELPEKNEIIKLIELTEQQANVYESIRITMSEEIRKAVKNQQANQILIGNALLRLRQVCCHPALLKLDTVKDAESAKLDWLNMAIPNLVDEGRKVLIFSSFTSMLQIIADNLDKLKVKYFKLTGATTPHKRTEQIEAFQSGDVPVFLISLKAGGAGINLTAADTVIHFDPWWNPAAEQQASDRAHRIGQDKQVFVYKLITHGTVEEKIHQMQQQKHQLADHLLSTSNNISDILSEHQWESMLAPLVQTD